MIKENRVFIVAELSGNHNHDINRAFAIIDAAAKAGADAIKFQTYTPDTITLNSNRPEFMVHWKGEKRSLYELYKEAHTPWEWHEKLFEHAKNRGLIAFSSPFDVTSVAFLEKLHVPLYKVASFEVVDTPLLEAIGKTKKPVILSRGMSTLDELQKALKTLKEFGTPQIIVLQCVSAYPAKPEEMHLKNIADMSKKLGVLTGLSDHTLTNESAIAGTALGACVIEKHLTLSRKEGGPDCEFSLEPSEFEALVHAIRVTEAAIGTPFYGITNDEKNLIKYRKSLFASKDIIKGETFTPENIRSVRPGIGLSPEHYSSLLGKKAAQDIPFATPLSWDLIE